jgi:hypothetical protein
MNKKPICEQLIGKEALESLRGQARKLHGDYTSQVLALIRKTKPSLSESHVILIYRSIC